MGDRLDMKGLAQALCITQSRHTIGCSQRRGQGLAVHVRFHLPRMQHEMLCLWHSLASGAEGHARAAQLAEGGGGLLLLGLLGGGGLLLGLLSGGGDVWRVRAGGAADG